MSRAWGVSWSREDEPSLDPDEITWYESMAEAVAEFNGRGDKYWHCPLVSAEITNVKVEYEAPSPFEHGYDKFYFGESA